MATSAHLGTRWCPAGVRQVNDHVLPGDTAFLCPDYRCACTPWQGGRTRLGDTESDNVKATHHTGSDWHQAHTHHWSYDCPELSPKWIIIILNYHQITYHQHKISLTRIITKVNYHNMKYHQMNYHQHELSQSELSPKWIITILNYHHSELAWCWIIAILNYQKNWLSPFWVITIWN